MQRQTQFQRANQAQDVSVTGSPGNWWENYLVRYLVGTIVGAMCTWALTRTHPQNLLPDFLDPKVIGQSNYLIVLAVCGFAYCYVASQLVLVVHIWRFMIEFRWKNQSEISWLSLLSRNPILLLSAYVMTMLVIGVGAYFLFPNRTPKAIVGGWQIAGACIALQYWMCISVFVKHRELYAFYLALADARATANKKGATVELIDSYRHMREHGNAFFILLSEVILLGYAYGCQYAIYGTTSTPADSRPVEQQLLYIAVAAIVWILPGASAWFVATSMEHKFAGWDYANSKKSV